MSYLASSQNGYPQRIHYNGQDIIGITPKQMTYILKAHITWGECREQNDSLLSLIDAALIADSLYNSRLRGKDTIISLQAKGLHLRDSLNTLQKASISDKDKKIEKVTKARNTWKVLGLSGWGAIIVAGLVLLL